MRQWKRPAFFVVALAASGFFTYLAVRNVDFEVFWLGLRTCDYWWLLPSLLALTASVWLRALRWWLLFTPPTRPSLSGTTRALLVSYLFNSVLPARAGEAARIIVLNREEGTSRAEAFGTAITERIYDVATLLMLLFVAAPFLPTVTWLRRAALLAAVLLLAIVVAVVVLERFRERPLERLLRPFALLPNVSADATDRAARNITLGLGALHRPRLAVPAFLVTVLSWLVMAVSFWLALIGFRLGVGFGAALLVLICTNLAMVLPSLPGAVGVFEAAGLVALHAFGVDKSHALPYVVVLHALNFFPFIVVGYYVLHGHARLRPATERPADATAPRR
jgi:glycosyltransferase 2 family protein